MPSTDRELDRQILRLALPTLISGATVPLLSAVDLALMGRAVDAAALGGVAMGVAVFEFVYWGFGFLRMGTTGLVAQAEGRGDVREGARVLGRALLLALLIGAALIALRGPVVALVLDLLRWQAGGAAPAALTAAEAYVRARIWAAPATLALYAIAGDFLGRGDATSPLILALTSNALNIALDSALVLGWGMGPAGVGWGTVAASWGGLLLGLALIWRSRPQLAATCSLATLDPGALGRFLAIGGAISVRTILLVGTLTHMRIASAALGDGQLAANAILLQLGMISAYAIDGVAFASERLVGVAVGAGGLPAQRRAVRRTMRWGALIGLLGGAVFLLAGGWLAWLFTDDQAVVALARPYLPWLAAGTFVGALAFVLDGAFLGASRGGELALAMAGCAAVYAIALELASPLANHGLWLAWFAFMAARAGSLAWLGRSWLNAPRGERDA